MEQRRTKRQPRRPYPTVHAWLDATGHTQGHLADMVGISEQHLANVLLKTRTCSFKVALRLARICNVPVESIASGRQLSDIDVISRR